MNSRQPSDILQKMPLVQSMCWLGELLLLGNASTVGLQGVPLETGYLLGAGGVEFAVPRLTAGRHSRENLTSLLNAGPREVLGQELLFVDDREAHERLEVGFLRQYENIPLLELGHPLVQALLHMLDADPRTPVASTIQDVVDRSGSLHLGVH